tara:strand:- start:245 stop:559 length:315 start_codon:yes stop_codon:yes gene_type:complete
MIFIKKIYVIYQLVFIIIKTKSIKIITFLILSSFMTEMSTANSENFENQLLNRKQITKDELKSKILENKNVDFSEFMTLEIDLDNTSINCFFGYQDGNRIVLCY